ncbi:hypothetical protein [Mycoplasma elephantis]|uniref:hypothetical protein n=1 Tax=Mycoplasma elephantis TaxID=114882 RepID=UPI00047F20EB|nr:hypothetical protein [Mycoplasma elephantis]
MKNNSHIIKRVGICANILIIVILVFPIIFRIFNLKTTLIEVIMDSLFTFFAFILFYFFIFKIKKDIFSKHKLIFASINMIIILFASIIQLSIFLYFNKNTYELLLEKNLNRYEHIFVILGSILEILKFILLIINWYVSYRIVKEISFSEKNMANKYIEEE